MVVHRGRLDHHQGVLGGSTPQIALANAANNHFSYTTYDFFANQNVADIHYIGNATLNYYLRTGYFTNNFNQITQAIQTYAGNPLTYSSSACPSRLGIFATGPILVQITGFTGRINHNRGMINGGNKDSLISVIQSGMSEGQIKNILMQYSPYLTSDVLLAYLGINPPNGHIKQVIEANSPVEDTVMAALNNMNLPHGIMNQINNAQTGTSALQALNDSTNYLEVQRIQLIDKLLRQYVSDTSNTDHAQDSIISTLKRFSFIESYKRLLAQVYLSKRDSVKAGQVNDSLKSQYGICDDTRLTDIQLAICNASCVHQAFTGDTALMPATAAIANANTGYPVCARAKALMAMALDTTIITHIEPLVFQNNQRRANTADTQPKWSASTAIRLFPNPAANQFSLVLTNPETTKGGGVMKLYNLLGQLEMQKQISYGKTVIDTKNLPTGVYLVNITLQNGQIWQQKVVIEK